MMKKIVLALLVQMSVLAATGQHIRFNADLDKFCKSSIAEFKTIHSDRKAELENIARQMVQKKYILFTCQTNSRRTILLQVWAQTAFYYYGLIDKLSFSVGDTVTPIYHGVAEVLERSGFYCAAGSNTERNGYVVSVNRQFPENLLLSKTDVGTIDSTRGILVNICYGDEQSEIAATRGHEDLPYQSPAKYENTLQEKQRYMSLNRKIAIEMLYMASRMHALVLNGVAD